LNVDADPQEFILPTLNPKFSTLSRSEKQLESPVACMNSRSKSQRTLRDNIQEVFSAMRMDTPIQPTEDTRLQIEESIQKIEEILKFETEKQKTTKRFSRARLNDVVFDPVREPQIQSETDSQSDEGDENVRHFTARSQWQDMMEHQTFNKSTSSLNRGPKRASSFGQDKTF